MQKFWYNRKEKRCVRNACTTPYDSFDTLLGPLSRLQLRHHCLPVFTCFVSPLVVSVARLIVTAMLRKRYQQEAKLMKPQLVLEPLKVGDKYVSK